MANAFPGAGLAQTSGGSNAPAATAQGQWELQELKTHLAEIKARLESSR